MIEVQLSKQPDRLIVAFDGHVLSYYSALDFRQNSKRSGRIHVAHIKAIGIEIDRRGTALLVVHSKNDVTFSSDDCDADALDRVKTLIAEVQRAMQTVAV